MSGTPPIDPGMSRDIPLTLIDADPNQPRQHFGQAALDELAMSLAENGQVVPIMVRPTAERFTIVHGERRWRAAQQLGWQTIRAEVRDLDADAAHWLALTENIQRADLSPIEEARVFQRRLGEDMTQRELGERIGKSQSYIAQKLRLLKLPSPCRLYVERGMLTEGHARQLLRLEGWYYGKRSSLDGAGTWTTSFERDPNWWLLAMLCAMRPESQPRNYILMIGSLLPPTADHVIDAGRAFSELVDHDGEGLPLWTQVAYWWATWAVAVDASVGELTRTIDLWRRRIWAAVWWFSALNGETLPPKHAAPGARPLSYGYRSDLRHAGLWDEIGDARFRARIIEEWADSTPGEMPLLLPSKMQPWGSQAKRGAGLVADPLGFATGDDEPDDDDLVLAREVAR